MKGYFVYAFHILAYPFNTYTHHALTQTSPNQGQYFFIFTSLYYTLTFNNCYLSESLIGMSPLDQTHRNTFFELAGRIKKLVITASLV